ncbi:DUF2243 domain-containing protein [Chelativorans sp. Marseille-P2723]|uniref:DUF2243 domain-containing protein n=1 Tax=Chelativorans sp. Marseille-P2723 TaxID=2709133 RepID=UPI00156E937B|nr:DUF2243 domain-containing protein [Chelativorans sp. Marseille-P2723]
MSLPIYDGAARTSSFRWAGYVLGFAIGGFFDGILLHQILQWHHLLSGLEGGRFGDLRFQIMADGAFHLVMYVALMLGLLLLWRSRANFVQPAADRALAANALIGFGFWHILDGIVSHWVLGIHRIRMDTDIPLLWDLVWFVLFGVAFVIAGYLMRRSGGGGRRGGRLAAAMTILALAGGLLALLPPGGNATTIIVFRPGISPGAAWSALASVEGELIWSDTNDGVWAVSLPEDASRLELYRRGALLVSGSAITVGCADWVDISWLKTPEKRAAGAFQQTVDVVRASGNPERESFPNSPLSLESRASSISKGWPWQE